MTREKRPPNRQPVPLITPGEKQHLTKLYMEAGAWTYSEAVSFLGESRFREMLQDRLLGRQDTEMGPVYHLLARGRLAAFGTADEAASLTTQLDLAYLRLSMAERGWRFADKTSPFYQGFDKLFPGLNFREAETELGRVLLAGKLSGGGYSVDGIERLMRQVKSTALSRNLLFVILTPHARRGQQRAQVHSSALRLIHHLPRVDGSKFTRFNPVSGHKKDPDPGPILTPAGAQKQRERGVIPDLTLDILQLSRKDRIEHAQAAIEVDQVLAEAQLARYYGLSPADLTGRLVTQAILRPSKNRSAHEVQQRVVVADRQVARLDDSNLNHRLTTAQMRLDLGIKADPERWHVEQRNALKLEVPDTIYITGDGERWAIEADTGQYNMPTILRKLQAFKDQEYAEIIWGTPSSVRVKNLTQKIAHDLRPTLKLTQWW
ncbi:replication-relaxation family protein [Deinococcus aluminii]|uniref:Uncharacterized protein n=1 Tax=Deinococcus aluminii TaxID=1656885 RepID=A0ABP9XGU2_9DEIO